MRNSTARRPRTPDEHDAARADGQIARIAAVLNDCLTKLDELGMHQAAAHLSTAIEHLPQQSAAPPVPLMDLFD